MCIRDRIGTDPTKSVTSVLSGIEASLDGMPDCTPIDYSEDLNQTSEDIQKLTRRIYNPDSNDDLISAIANRR